MKPVFLFIQIGAAFGSTLGSIMLGWRRRENRCAGQPLGGTAERHYTGSWWPFMVLSCKHRPACRSSQPLFHRSALRSLFPSPLSSFLSSPFLCPPHTPPTSTVCHQKHCKTMGNDWLVQITTISASLLKCPYRVINVSFPSLVLSTTDFTFPDVESTCQFRGELELPTPSTVTCKIISKNITELYKTERRG